VFEKVSNFCFAGVAAARGHLIVEKYLQAQHPSTLSYSDYVVSLYNDRGSRLKSCEKHCNLLHPHPKVS
jgi:hypothetical protein